MIEDYHNEATAQNMVRELNKAFVRGAVAGVCLANIIYAIIWVLIKQ